MQTWALIVDSFREARDRKIFRVMIIITLVLALAMACVGFDSQGISLLFGLVRLHYEIPPTVIKAFAVHILVDAVLGLAGVTLVLIATAGIFPALMERGAIDVILSKPLARSKLFLGKYVGSMVFVLVQATLFIVLMFLVLWLRWKVWMPALLAGIPLLVVFYSYIYCVCVLVAVYTRSTIAAILISIACWIAFSLVQNVPSFFENLPKGKEHRLYPVTRTLTWLLPRTQDIPYIAARWTGAGTSADLVPPSFAASDPLLSARLNDARRLEEAFMRVNPAKSIGASLGFELVIVLIAMRKFSKSDF